MDTSIYLDNAATTKLAPEVLEAMMPYLTESYGNPSSTYAIGITTRLAIESARKSVAGLLGVKPWSIFFTSGGTESNNTAIAAAIRDLGCTCIITSPIEHHAVLHTVEHYSKSFHVPIHLVSLTEDGSVDYADLENKLKEEMRQGNKPLVSLMHANNEIGNILNINYVGALCEKYHALFHSDCVQTVGHYPLDLSQGGVHFISGAGHKFHGPKGVGILYVSPSLKIQPLIHGGGQERNMRAGTENLYGIVGFAKALEIAMQSFQKESSYISGLKAHMKQRLHDTIPGVCFNGSSNSLYTVLSVCFPKTEESDSLLLSLDMEGICVSGGSACSSSGGSHVMKALGKLGDCNTLRFSFSKYNTTEEIDRVIEVLRDILIPKISMIV